MLVSEGRNLCHHHQLPISKSVSFYGIYGTRDVQMGDLIAMRDVFPDNRRTRTTNGVFHRLLVLMRDFESEDAVL